MKLKLCTILFFLATYISAQEFSGKAIYKTSRKTNFKISTEKSTMSDTQMKEIEARIKKMHQKTFILEFDKNKSTYKEDVKLNAPQPKAAGKVFSFGGSGSNAIYYKNIAKKNFYTSNRNYGKTFFDKR